MADAVTRIKELDQERAKLLDTARKEALARAQAAVADLNALGFEFQLTSRADKKTTRKGTRTIKDAPCPVCKFKTEPPHDRRAHRFTKNPKRPFTAAELKEKGYTKV